jgi:multicomponent Na+:H+ antiporter subunit E
MSHVVVLAIALSALWLVLSGLLLPHILALAIASVAFVVWIAVRMDVVDREGLPVHLRWGDWFVYLAWLTGQAIRSNIDVARRILDPAMPISPTVITLETGQHSDLSRVIFANSITLTPGTVSMDLEGGTLTVHSLTREGAETLLGGEMDRRVTALEDPQ